MTLFAADPEQMAGSAPIESVSGGTVALADLRPGELFLTRDAAEELQVAPGDQVVVFVRALARPMEAPDVVTFRGTGSEGGALLLPLAEALRDQ